MTTSNGDTQSTFLFVRSSQSEASSSLKNETSPPPPFPLAYIRKLDLEVVESNDRIHQMARDISSRRRRTTHSYWRTRYHI